MQTLEDMLIQRDVLTGSILEKVSDLRASKDVVDVCQRLFTAFPECNGIVLMAAYKSGRGERAVYSFDEIEESKNEGKWYFEIGEDLVTINSWISENRPSKWEPEIDDLFEELAELYPYPLEEEIDWNGMDLDSKFEILLLKNGEYV